MAVTAKLYSRFPENLGGGNASGDGPMDLLSDSIRVTLHTSTYTPSQTGNEVKADATNELTTANGYTALGQALAGKTYAATALVTMFDANDVTWNLTGSVTFRHLVCWDDTPTAPADPLILYNDTSGDQTVNGVDLVWQWHATNGIFQITVA
jgi:hypothetical protein